MKYLWSDAWLLQAIALATKTTPATLAQIIAAADAVNHAMLTQDELHGGLVRLTEGGYIEELDERFSITSLIPVETVGALASGIGTGRSVAQVILDSEVWSSENAANDVRNRDLIYPGLTDNRLRAAEREYRRHCR